MKIVLDANILIAFSNTGHIFHANSIGILGQPNSVFLIHRLTLAEYLVHPARLGIARDALRIVRDDLMITSPDPEDIENDEFALELADVRATTGLRMPDAVILATARRVQAKVATFDESLLSAATAEGRAFNS